MRSLFYKIKKALGFSTYADDLAHLNQNWQSGPGLFSALGKSLSPITNFLTTTIGKPLTFLAALSPGIAAGVATFKSAPIIVTTVKTVVAGALVALTATGAISVAEKIDQRTNQFRAVATDSLRRPINLDNAINPAYHGKRDEMDEKKKLTARYLGEKFGEDYQVTPFIGYEQPDLPGLDPDDFGLVQVVDGEAAVDLIEVIDDEEERAIDFMAQKIRADFEESIGGFVNEEVNVTLTAYLTDPGRHGLELVNEGINQVVTGTTTTLDINGHLQVIDLIGEEAFSEVFKVEVAEQSAIRYFVSLYKGETNVGPATYINTMDNKTVFRLVNDTLEEFFAREQPDRPVQDDVQLDVSQFRFRMLRR